MTLANYLKAAAGNAGGENPYIEDVFSTYLYTANNQTAQTITNGIDLSGEGGLVWIKTRSAAYEHFLADTARGAANYLQSQSSAAQINNITELTSFNSNGFSLGTDSSGIVNFGSTTLVSWTFRKAEKFFDVVTYTGNGAEPSAWIPHNLGAVPGMIVIKRTDAGGAADKWYVWHRTLADYNSLQLNEAAAVGQNFIYKASDITSTQFRVFFGGTNIVNINGATYVAYLFAHNAGGFGDDGSENVITCGSFTTDAGGLATVNLGYEPQWMMVKCTSNADNWNLMDQMRGWNMTTQDSTLYANLTNAESTANWGNPTATGFQASFGSSRTYIYIAIRRGPMKTPTSGTEVFAPVVAASGTATTNFPIDMQILSDKGSNNSILNQQFIDRLRGVSSTSTQQGVYLLSSSTAAESSAYPYSSKQWSNTGFGIPQNYEGASSLYLSFRRAPGFFDVVCYTGTGVDLTVNHNLGVVPEWVIIKNRSRAGTNWSGAYFVNASQYYDVRLNQDIGRSLITMGPGGPTLISNSATTFGVLGGSTLVNTSGDTYVAYLFATLPGISKVGSYTGTGATQQINCGFTGGARFVLVKATSTTGNWLVWDAARGIVAGNDPYLALNSTAAEVTTTDWVDTYSAGFELSSAGGNLANTNGVSYIFCAVA